MRRKLEELETEERKIDNDIASINSQIKQDYLDREDLRQYHYITYDDCLNICKSMNKNDPNKNMIIISAPRGSALEVGEEEKGECVLRMDATGKDRPIRVYTCKPNEGVFEVSVTK
jgi:NADH:ubiquinone oxidoreductase subunit D